MQEKQVHNVARAEDSGDDTEQAAERAGDGEWDEIIGTGHFSSPDLASQCPKQTPEDDGAAAHKGGPGDQDERTQHPAGESGRDGVEHIGLGPIDIVGDLQDKGQLVGVRRHLAGKAGEADACEDDDLPGDAPVL